MNFNQELCVQESVNKHIVNAAAELTMRAIEACALHYKFDAQEAKCMLGLSSLRVVEGKSSSSSKPKGKSLSLSKEKKVKEKSLCPLPFNGERAEECCDGLRFNNGLYTQCKTEKSGNNLCKTCKSSADKNDGVPEYGTIQQRMAVGIFEYVDPKGRKPTSFLKVIKKLKVTEDQVNEEASRLNIVLNEEHMKSEEKVEKKKKVVAEEEPKKLKKGRPKKSKKEVELNEECDDIFATLVANAASEEVVEEVVEDEGSKEAERESMKKAEKESKEAEKAAKKEQERQEKEAKKEQERQEKEAEKVAKKEAEKVAKEAAKEQERLKKEADKAAKEEERLKKEAEKLSKESEKAAKEVTKKKPAAKKTSGKATPVLEEEEEVQEVVKKITFEGKKYLVSKNSGIVYDFEKYTTSGEQVAVGMWIESKNKIEFKSADEEESEDEYDM